MQIDWPSLFPRPSHHPVFDCLQYTKVENSPEHSVLGLTQSPLQVLKIQVKDKAVQFLIHYSGWNKTYDSIG